MKRLHAPRNARHATIYHSTRGNIIVVTSFGGLKKSLVLRHTHVRGVYVTRATGYRIVVTTSHCTACVCVGDFLGDFRVSSKTRIKNRRSVVQDEKVLLYNNRTSQNIISRQINFPPDKIFDYLTHNIIEIF